MEKAQKIKGKVKAAMYYPCAVLCVATAILILLMTFVVPRFKEVLEGLLGGGSMPAFTMFIMRLSDGGQAPLPAARRHGRVARRGPSARRADRLGTPAL